MSDIIHNPFHLFVVMTGVTDSITSVYGQLLNITITNKERVMRLKLENELGWRINLQNNEANCQLLKLILLRSGGRFLIAIINLWK